MTAKQKVDALILAGNTATGESRTDLTAVVQDLVDGYGSEDSIITSANCTNLKVGNSYVEKESVSYRFGRLKSNSSTYLSINPYNITKGLRICVKYKLDSYSSNLQYPCLISDGSAGYSYLPLLFAEVEGNHYPAFEWKLNNTTQGIWLSYETSLNTWYYLVFAWDKKFEFLSLYDENGNLLQAKAKGQTGTPTNTSQNVYVAGRDSNSSFQFNQGIIDLSETFIEVDDTIVWGATNSKTANMCNFDFTNPAEFTKVDWIGSSGTQYIQTDVVLNSTDKVEAQVAFMDTSATTFAWCARESLSSKFINALHLAGTMQVAYYDANESLSSIVQGQKYKISTDGNKFYVDDVLVKTFTAMNFNTVNPACLMASYNPYGTYANKGAMRHSGFKVDTSNDIPRCEYIPVYHTALGIIGMFDVVRNKFNMNAGTGTFEIPSDTSNEINLAEYLASLT